MAPQKDNILSFFIASPCAFVRLRDATATTPGECGSKQFVPGKMKLANQRMKRQESNLVLRHRSLPTCDQVCRNSRPRKDAGSGIRVVGLGRFLSMKGNAALSCRGL